ncbi:hypothetical protein BSL78_29306 [Apostichopus japonicus]|uniref:Uncharacterized protein n=1 Tax=Stichopus japonicus TaxID=307972 RepID=A0A2G8JDT0_STIJA|nr:hypothetical protein BSL78_29306 [Apostichopus japonicus]
MNTKLVCFFLVMTVIVATVTAYEDDDLEFAFQDMMEKRGRGKGGRGKGPEFMRCPGNERCFCALTKNGQMLGPLACGQSDVNVGI